ncbi:MAG: hypothetical protein DHS80DRAFT_9525, partial [Piptocephalis tieghemiana]
RRWVWWACFCLDRLLSAQLGRPMIIEERDCDVILPRYDEKREGMIESEEDRSSRLFFGALIRLTIILGRVLRKFYSVKS